MMKYSMTKACLVGSGNMATALLRKSYENGADVSNQGRNTARTQQAIESLQEAFPNAKLHNCFETATTPDSKLGSSSQAVKKEDMLASACYLGIKPQVFAAMPATDFPPQFRDPKSVIISMLAGTPISKIAEKFPENVACMRTMPNLACSIGQGTTAVLSQNIDSSDIAEAVLSSLSGTGMIVTLESENEFHAFTGVAGSGPAFTFTLLEHFEKALEGKVPGDAIKATALSILREAAHDLVSKTELSDDTKDKLNSFMPEDSKPSANLSEDTISTINTLKDEVSDYLNGAVEGALATGGKRDISEAATLSTLLGASTYYEKSSEDLNALRVQVTSPNGTTYAGLQVLLKRGEGGENSGPLTHQQMNNTTQATAKRSEELQNAA